MDEEGLISEQRVISEEGIEQLLNELKEDKNGNSTALSILENSNAQRYFKYNIPQYCAVVALIVDNFEKAAELTAFLKNDRVIYKNLLEREDFSVAIFPQFLPSLISASIKIDNYELHQIITKIIQKCLFNKNLNSFQNYLNGKSKDKICKTLIKFLTNLYTHEEQVYMGFKMIFDAFCQAFKTFDAKYKMLAVMTEIIGFDFNLNSVKIKNSASTVTLSKSIGVLSALIEVVSKTRIDSDCKLSEISFNDYIKNLIQSVITLSGAPNESCYKILLLAIEINPLIIETLINDVIVFVMLSDNSKYRNEYNELMVKIFEVFNKLHRIQNLISKMIPTLQNALIERTLSEAIYPFRGDIDLKYQSIDYEIHNIFPNCVLNYFTNCITNLASWQVMNLFKTLLHHLAKAVEDLSETAPNCVFMEILSTVTCRFLSSVRMAEHTVAPATVLKFVGALKELQQILEKFGKNLLHREHNRILMRAFLNISYNWGEVYMALSYYSSEEETQMTITQDNDFSPCNLTYLHPYLSGKEWCLISERITNFGEKPCKGIMQKLFIQKLRASVLFEDTLNEDMAGPIINNLSNLEDSSEILADKFVIEHLLPSLKPSAVLNLSENILTAGKSRNLDSPVIIQGVLCVIFSKISKLFRQKRKLEDDQPKKALCTRIFAFLRADIFLTSNQDTLEKIASLVNRHEDRRILDIKIQDDKVYKYLQTIQELPVIFCPENSQKILALLLFSLHQDLSTSNCSGEVKAICESLLIGLVQHPKYNLFEVFDNVHFLGLTVDNFDRLNELFTLFASNSLKSDDLVPGFASVVGYLEENLKEDRVLLCASIVLTLLNKMKKTKLSADSKELCNKFKMSLCNKIVKLVVKKGPEERYIQPYSLALKTFLVKDENGNFQKLKERLVEYVDFALKTPTENTTSLPLFATILHQKSLIGEFPEDYPAKVWDCLKSVTISGEVSEEYSSLVILIATLIPNEKFSSIVNDLFSITQKSMKGNEFSKNLKTWTSLISSNFNPVKTKALHTQLERLLEELLLMIKDADYREDLVEEVIRFEVSIIHTIHLPLTAVMMDLFLVTVPVLMMKQGCDFIHVYNSSMALLEGLLKCRNPLIMDRLPPFLQQYRILIKELCTRSDSNLNLATVETQKLADCAHQLEKLTKILVTNTRDVTRISPYLIADILAQYELVTLYPNVKIHLNNCLYSLIALCDQHAVSYLMRVLSNASTEIFKMMFENYKKYYRFTGKV